MKSKVNTRYNAIPGAMAAPINSWTDFINILSQLKKPEVKEKYHNIIIDTADIAYDYCEQYICMKEGKDSISLIPFGAGYSMVEKEFDRRCREIVQNDYGLIFISHAGERTFTDELGVEITKTGPTINKRGEKVVNRMADLIGYIKPVNHKTTSADGTVAEETETYMFMRGTSRYIAGSRFKYIDPYIKFSYDNLVEAIHKAIDKEKEEKGEGAITQENHNIYKNNVKKADFNDVINEFAELSQKLLDKQVPSIQISSIVEGILGKGRFVRDCTPDQQELVELINTQFKEMLSNIK